MRKLLFFHADYCPPCHKYDREYIKPLEALVGKDKIERINAVDEPHMASAYHIDKLPTVVLLEGDVVVHLFNHPPDMDKLTDWINEV